MPLDPRTPVLVGAGQISNRVDQGADILEPVDLMAEGLRRAEADTGATGVLAAADSVRVISSLSWRYGDPGALVASRLHASPRETMYTVNGGNYVQKTINRTALEIQRGELDVVLLTGAEAFRSRQAARRDGIDLGWTSQAADVEPTIRFGSDESLSNDLELSRGAFLPVQLYPMFEVAHRHAEGLTVEAHRQKIAALWSRFSEVAATNPHAWIQQAYTPDEIATATADNRMIGFPYTKRMNSNNNVDQGAGLIMMSVEKATALGIARERWIFPHAGADANDHWFVSDRDDLHSSPAMRFVGRSTLELAGVGIDDLAHVDVYSCFPSAVQIAVDELGLDLERQLTITGGLSFAGGPWNNYVMHSVATMAGVLRDDPGTLGLITANGGWITEHAMGVYSTEPPPSGAFRWADVQDQVDGTPTRPSVESHEGAVTIEAYTVMYDREDAPERGIVVALLPDGRRTWAHSTDAVTMKALVADDLVGRAATTASDGTITVD